jgi:hypothetical protein
MRAAWWKTPELMPAPIFYAHRILKVMAQARRRVPGQQHPQSCEFSICELAGIVINMTGSRSKIVSRPLPAEDPRQRWFVVRRRAVRLYRIVQIFRPGTLFGLSCHSVFAGRTKARSMEVPVRLSPSAKAGQIFDSGSLGYCGSFISSVGVDSDLLNHNITCGVIALARKTWASNAWQIPDEIRQFWGEPSILSTEDAGTYEKLAASVIESIKPIDGIEWLWTKDVVDHFFDISRLRRFKIRLLALKCQEEIERAQYHDEDESDSSVSERVTDVQRHYESEQGETELFLVNLKSWERIDQLLTTAEARLAAILREMDRRRTGFSERARRASSELIDGEFKEQTPDSTSSRQPDRVDSMSTGLAPAPKRGGVPRVALNPTKVRPSSRRGSA